MKLGWLLLQLGLLAWAQDFDLLIRGGRIVDGTGNPSYLGDIAIRQGKIAAMGHLAARRAPSTPPASPFLPASSTFTTIPISASSRMAMPRV